MSRRGVPVLASVIPPYSTLLEALFDRARRDPERLAFAAEGASVTFGELHAAVARLAGGLAASGLRPGDRCALCLPNGLAFVRCFLAVQWLEAIPLPLSPDLPPPLRARRVAAAHCRMVVDSDSAAGLRQISRDTPLFPPPRPDPDHVAYLLYTSGTSGNARPAVILQRNLVAALRSTHRLFALDAADVLVGWIPLYHTFGLARFVCTPLFSGCTCHLVPTSLGTLRRWLEVITATRATVTAASDFAYRTAALLVDPKGLDLTSLRCASSGGEPVRLDTIRRFENSFGVPGRVRPGYGLTEATVAVASVPPGLPLTTGFGGAVSCGPPVDGIEVRIVDEDGRGMPTGQVGEILVRGEAVFAGYDADEEETASVLRGGWLHTGDVGALDGNGWLTVIGRQREMIKRGGVAIAPRELEEAAERVPGIARAAAVGLRDGRDGNEEIVLLAEIEPGLAPTGLGNLARQISAAVKELLGAPPGRILILGPSSLPRTATGKPRTSDIKAALAGHAGERAFPGLLARF